MNIAHYLDYRDFIKNHSERTGITYKSLAQNAGIHSSYFSRVMVKHADFSQEQLYTLGNLMTLSEWEINYFLLLGEYSASGNSDHKKYLKAKIESVREEKLKLIDSLEGVDRQFVNSKENIQTYYQESVTSKIHMYLTIEKYRLNPALISKKIFISEEKMASELQKLESLGLITIQKNGSIKIHKENIHLEEASPLSFINHTNWRMEAINNITRREPKPSDYHFTVIFSSNEKTKIKIKEHFKEFVVKCQKLVGDSEAFDEVYYMDFDLY